MRRTTMVFGTLVCASIVLAEPAIVTTQPFTRPATMPTTKPATKAAVEIAPEAGPLLQKLNQAYAEPRAMSLRVNVKGDFVVAGRARQFTLNATGYTDGRGRFDHDVAGVGRVVQTDDRVIIYDARRNAYGIIEQKPAVRKSNQIASALSDIFIDENPALLMLITNEPAKLLERGADTITAIDGSLVLTSATEVRTLHLDDAGMVRSMTIDYTPLLESRGASQIKSAVATLTYVQADFSPAPVEAFTFDIPSGAVEFRIGSELIRTTETAPDAPDHLKRLIEQLRPDATTQPASD